MAAADQTAIWNTKLRYISEFSADSVEWCPVQPYCNVLVCGTYELAEEQENSSATTGKQQRLGRIYLFIVEHDTTELLPTQTIHTSGILDQKWCYHKIANYPVLAVVTSEGILQLYRLHDVNAVLELRDWLKHVVDPQAVVLSVDWSTNKTSSEEPRLVVSDSMGFVHVLAIVGEELVVLWSCESHAYEAWIAAFNYWNPDIFYSGADDFLFISYDIRTPKVATTVNKSHDTGVTCIRNNLDVEHQLLTGSFDEKIRLWDTRNLKSCLNEKKVTGGGIWRLKWHPFKPKMVLAACMHTGFRILSVTDHLEILSEYKEHSSLGYGADWKFDEDMSLVATCSFYDRRIHISEITF